MATQIRAGGVIDNSTPIMSFTASAPFDFKQHNASARTAQVGEAKERYYTSSKELIQQVITRDPRFRVVEPLARIKCVPREHWAATDFTGKRVLFILSTQALGESVSTLLFLHAFAEQRRPKGLGVFSARSSADIYLTTDLVKVYPLWMSRRDLKGWDLVIDLDHLESRRNIETWPVDMEADLLGIFGLQPSARFPSTPRTRAFAARPLIGILPLASSSLRTLPVPVTLALVEALRPHGRVMLSLNRNQGQGRLYADALRGRLASDVEVVDVYPAISDLLNAVDALDFGIFADSGPAHMSKLFATPGVAVYSSAPGDVLQGRFANLARWTIPFVGPDCASPCGLAKLRQAVDGRIGCMGSLHLPLSALPGTPRGGDAGVVEQLFREPVPCLAHLADNPNALVGFVLERLAASRVVAQA